MLTTADTLLSEATPMLSIHAVERETGVSKELLRMWERRYAFPHPNRDAHGDRIYPPDQVAKLRLLRRLIDNGFRPGKIIGLNLLALENLLRSQYSEQIESSSDLEQELMAALKRHDVQLLREYLLHQLTKMGLQSFILEFLQHANTLVGDAWMRGFIDIHEEHLYTEQVQSLIRGAINTLKAATLAPRILLTTPPDEAHTLGILMAEAMLRVDHIDAVCFGAQMPALEIVHAARKHRMHIVALSFSASYPSSRAIEFLEALRLRLPNTIEIWAGGSALHGTRRQLEGVLLFSGLAGIRQALQEWQARTR